MKYDNDEMKITDVKEAEDEQLNIGDIEFEVGCGGTSLMAGDSSLVERTLKAISKAVKNYPHANIKVRFICG